MLDTHYLFINIAQAATKEAAAGGPLGSLGINWKLLLGQLVNFAIILFIFWRWVVKPLGKTLADRQKRIEDSLKSAEEVEYEKVKLQKAKVDEMRSARAEAEKIIKEAAGAAEQMKNKIVGEAQYQAAQLARQTQAHLAAEKEKMIKEAKAELAEVVVSASEKIVRAKLDSSKDMALVEESLRELKA